MKIFEIGTGYTSVPARMGAATEIVVAGTYYIHAEIRRGCNYR